MKNYFEGWYFKIVDKEEKNIYAIIPGISFGNDGTTQAFIQFFDGINVNMDFFTFEASKFSYSKEEFDVKIESNIFNSDGFELDIDNGDKRINGGIKLGSLKPWPVKALAPGAMGWYRFVPFMECYHGVLSFDHTLEGSLTINGNTIDFTGGRGYLEKDYGKSFPRYYVWMQTNHFEEEGASLMASIANIPWLGSSFDGFIGGLLYNGKIFRFTNYTGAKITKFQMLEDKIIVHFEDKKYRLELEASKTSGVDLPSPMEGSMTGRVLESITSKIHVRLFKLHKNAEKIIFEGTGRNAGLDIGGHVEELKEIP